MKTIVENGLSTSPTDSIVYIFSTEGTMQIKSYNIYTASPADQVYTYSLQESILRYWNFDYNVNEEKNIYLSDNKIQLSMYSNTIYHLNRLF